jgi:hypothetical protein
MKERVSRRPTQTHTDTISLTEVSVFDPEAQTRRENTEFLDQIS